MAPTPLRFRVCLGGYRGETSLVVHSAKGIEWRDIPPQLETVLMRITTWDILDLSLGPNGQYYLRYKDGQTIKSLATPVVEKRVKLELLAGIEDITNISFGPTNEFWAVVEVNGVARQTLVARPRISDVLLPKKTSHPDPKDISIVAFGQSKINVVMKIGNRVIVGPHDGVRGASRSEQAKNDRIVAVTLSPLNNSHFFITFADGSYRACLPRQLTKIIKPHLEQKASLLLRQTVAVSPPITSSAQSSDTFATDHLGHMAMSATCSTQLRLLDPGDPAYKRIESSFYDGWRHPQKPRPDLRYIYEVKLPRGLMSSYQAYYLEVSSAAGSTEGIERELFHGTSRQCLVGNEPELNKLCENASCRLCFILKTSFTTRSAGTAAGRVFLRFGRGIYTSSVSSKADDYTVTPPISGYRAMLVARVVLGKAYSLKVTSQYLSGPPSGYHSVLGEVGVHLNYDEQVVYKDEAARPAFLIVYKP